MKHFALGIILLALLLTASLWSVGALNRTADRMEADLLEAWERSLQGDFPGAAEKAGEAVALWEKHYGTTASLSDHERLCEIDRAFGALMTCGRQGKMEEFAAGCYDLAVLVRSLAEAEKPYYYNFL